jgi:DNA-binding SARP family transcriptional activator/tetratricopeptide (TPR) repeat protein
MAGAGRTTQFTILGDVGLSVGGQPIAVRSVRIRLILALLLAHPGNVLSIDQLSDALWGPLPPKSSRENVRFYVHRLRAMVGGDVRIAHEAGGYRLGIVDDRLDAKVFEDLSAQGQRAMTRNDPAAASRFFAEGLRLWRGRAFGELAEVPALLEEAQRLDERRLATLTGRIEAELMLGQQEQLIPEIGKLVADHPFREGNRAQLMLALYRAGRQTEALRVYDEGRQLLSEELGLSPSPGLRQLQESILAQDPSLDLLASSPGPRELPADITTFTGRSDLVERIASDLVSMGPRPVVISGSGGVGKSALAVRVAWRVAGRFPDGQLYLDLHGATPDVSPLSPADSLGRLLRSLGLVGADVPVGTDEASCRFRSLTSGRRMLIVLDNVLDSAQIRPLLPSSPTCGVLVTSRRELVSLEGRIGYQLGVLPEADARSLVARLVLGPDMPDDDATLTEVARLCGGLPLAISIAAARLATRPAWTLESLAARLRNERNRLPELEDGDRAVRASFMVSYNGLNSAEARMFRLVSLLEVSHVGIAVAAALAEVTEQEAEDFLDHLVESRLMEIAAPGRYRMHDLIRLFAQELALAHDPPEERVHAVCRALHHYLATARRASAVVLPVAIWRTTLGPKAGDRADIGFSGREDVYAWVDAEAANLPAVLRQATTLPAEEMVAALSAALFFPLYERGRWRELEQLARLGAGAADRLDDSLMCAVTHSDLGYVQADMGEPMGAIRHLELALAHYRELNNRRGQAAQLDRIGVVYSRLGQFDKAISRFDESVELENGSGNRFGEAITMTNLGLTYRRADRFEEAVRALEKSLAITYEIGDRVGTAIALGHLAEVNRLSGAEERAADLFREALDADAAAGNRGSLTEAVHWWGLGLALHDLGRGGEARECWQRSAEVLQALNLIGARELADIKASSVPTMPSLIQRNM